MNDQLNDITAAASVLDAPPARFPPDVPASSGRLHLNEPAFAPSPKVLAAIANNAQAAARYPDAHCAALRHKLSELLDVDPAQLVCGNGSDELLALTGMAFLEKDAPMVMPTPSFPRYAMMGRFAGADMKAVTVRADGACDHLAMLEACDDSTRLMLMATPNNPTGQMLSAQELGWLASETPPGTLLLVDEAYYEFAQQAGGCDALQVLRERDGHWLVLRTLSKAYALAGLRVGYAIGSSADLIELLNRVRTTFNVNALAQIAALAALDDPQHMREQVALCTAERDRLAQALTKAGMPSLPSAANFIAVNCGREAAPVVQALSQHGIYIGSVGPAHPNHLRITIGSRADNDRVIAALAEL